MGNSQFHPAAAAALPLTTSFSTYDVGSEEKPLSEEEILSYHAVRTSESSYSPHQRQRGLGPRTENAAFDARLAERPLGPSDDTAIGTPSASASPAFDDIQDCTSFTSMMSALGLSVPPAAEPPLSDPPPLRSVTRLTSSSAIASSKDPPQRDPTPPRRRKNSSRRQAAVHQTRTSFAEHLRSAAPFDSSPSSLRAFVLSRGAQLLSLAASDAAVDLLLPPPLLLADIDHGEAIEVDDAAALAPPPLAGSFTNIPEAAGPVAELAFARGHLVVEFVGPRVIVAAPLLDLSRVHHLDVGDSFDEALVSSVPLQSDVDAPPSPSEASPPLGAIVATFGTRTVTSLRAWVAERVPCHGASFHSLPPPLAAVSDLAAFCNDALSRWLLATAPTQPPLALDGSLSRSSGSKQKLSKSKNLIDGEAARARAMRALVDALSCCRGVLAGLSLVQRYLKSGIGASSCDVWIPCALANKSGEGVHLMPITALQATSLKPKDGGAIKLPIPTQELRGPDAVKQIREEVLKGRRLAVVGGCGIWTVALDLKVAGADGNQRGCAIVALAGASDGSAMAETLQGVGELMGAIAESEEFAMKVGEVCKEALRVIAQRQSS